MESIYLGLGEHTYISKVNVEELDLFACDLLHHGSVPRGEAEADHCAFVLMHLKASTQL